MSTTAYGSEYIQCPFFLSITDTKMRCEGFSGTDTVTVSFGSKEEKKAYKQKHCDADYKHCALYRLAMEKYED